MYESNFIRFCFEFAYHELREVQDKEIILTYYFLTNQKEDIPFSVTLAQGGLMKQ